MISVVTAYYNRKKLFQRTLNSMMPYYGKVDFEVIVVDDGSDELERLEDLQTDFPFLRVIRLEKENKWYKNPCIPFNIGFSEIKGDKVIIFKKKRRKGYQKKNGFRAYLTEIVIEKIG